MNRAERVAMVDRSRPDLSVRRQCALLDWRTPRSIASPAAPDPEELAVMRWLDEQYLATPFYAAALGRHRCVAHNSTGPTTAKRGIHLTRKRSMAFL